MSTYKSQVAVANLKQISKRVFNQVLKDEASKDGKKEENKDTSSSNTGAISTSEESRMKDEFEKSHPGFVHTIVTRKLLPYKIGRLMTETYEELAQEKIQRMLNKEPYKSAGIERIFKDDNLRTLLEQDSQLDDEDQKEVLVRVREKTEKKEFLDDLVEHAMILSDPDKFAEAYFLDEPPYLRKVAEREIKDPSELSLAITKYKQKSELTFKLLITSIKDYEYEKLELFTRLKMKVAAALTNWGLNHAALQIGPYIIDWNDSSLVVPRMLSSKHAKALIPINDRVTPTKSSAVATISRIICHWNKNFTYEDVINFNENSKKGNCQHFVQQILDALAIQSIWKPEGPVNTYIKKIASGKMGKSIILMDPEGKERTITVHPELKAMYKEVFAHPKVVADRQLHEEYTALFKCVERTFQLKHSGNPDVYEDVLDPIFGDFTGKISSGRN